MFFTETSLYCKISRLLFDLLLSVNKAICGGSHIAIKSSHLGQGLLLNEKDFE